MTIKKIALGGLTATMLATSTLSSAGEIEGNVALATDYVFRGFSQTIEEPAMWLGLQF